MSRKVKAAFEKKATPGAPAYMGQYASLMTVLLALFIIMLTLGRNRTAQFKVGVGMIRNMIGLTGGAGVLDFWDTVRNPATPHVAMDASDKPDARLIGYEADMGDSYSLGVRGVENIAFLAMRDTFRLRSPLRFDPGRIRVAREMQSALDHTATILYSLKGHQVIVIVRAHAPPGAADAERLLAARRASWLARHLVEHGCIQAERIRSLGQVREVDETGEPGETEVFFWMRRDADQNVLR